MATDPAVLAARRAAALARLDERIRIAVENAPALPADLERMLRELILSSAEVSEHDQRAAHHCG